MSISHLPLAAAAPVTSEVLFPGRSGSSDWGPFLVIAASCLVGLAAVVGAVIYYTRRRRQRPHHHHRHRPHRKEPGGTSSDRTSPADGSSSGDGGRLRRRRRNHRPRNPTLAETGGLPPIRKDPPPGP